MRIAIFGTGGVGGYFGGRLAQAGQDVVFIARGQNLAAIQANGLQVDSIDGDFYLPSVQATDDPSSVGPVDAILVAVKAWQIPEAALAIQPMVGQQTCVIPLENGVEAPEQLAATLGEKHVLGGLCQISAYRAGPGYIRHVGIKPTIALGELNGQPSQRVEALRQALAQAGIQVRVPEDIRVAMWEKFVFIAAVSGVGAVCRAPMGIYRSMPETRQMLEQALEEIVAVGQANGVQLAGDTAARTLRMIEGMPGEVVASMQRDILDGKPSELEAQNGAVVRMGRTAGVPTPTHAFLYASLLPQERRARREISF